MYPAIIGSVAFLVVLALLFVVLPMLIQNFSSRSSDTGDHLAVLDAGFCRQYWYAILALIIGFGCLSLVFQHQCGKWQSFDYLKVPVLEISTK